MQRVIVRVLRRPSAIQRVNGPLIVHRASVPLDSELAVRVLDAHGAALRGAHVTWMMPHPIEGATLRMRHAVTDSDGVSTAAFTPGRSGSAQHVIADVSDVGRIDFSVFVPVAFMRVEPNAITLWSADSATVGVVLRDSAGVTLSGGEGVPRWRSSDTTTARVSDLASGQARITGLLAGSADVIAWIGDVSASARVVVRPQLDVRFVTLDSSAPPPLHFEVRSGVLLDSATVRDGHYVRRVDGVGDDVEIRARELARPRAYQDVAVRVQQPRALQSLRIVLVPRVWHIDAGTYAGRDVPIDADAAMRRVGDGGVFWRLVPGSGRGPRTVLGWPDDRLPLHLAFDGSTWRDGNVDADSVTFWSVAQQMERDLGRALFAPAELADSTRVDVIPIEIRAQSAEAQTSVTWNDSGDAYEGILLFRNEATLRDPHVITHELLHLLGFGHTLAWPSVSRPTGGVEASLTSEDVAYAQLAMRLRDVQRATGARPGLPVARQ